MQRPSGGGSSQRRGHSSAPTTEEVQRMLDENTRLIEVTIAKQNEGKVIKPRQALLLYVAMALCVPIQLNCLPLQVDECSQFLSKLHNNLLFLATLADTQQAQALQREREQREAQQRASGRPPPPT